MGHAISRTKPSIVASERFARAPSIDVFCREAGIAAIAATQQPLNRQKRRIRFIAGDEYISAASASIKVTGVNRPLHPRPESATRHSGTEPRVIRSCAVRRQINEKRATRGCGQFDSVCIVGDSDRTCGPKRLVRVPRDPAGAGFSTSQSETCIVPNHF